MARRFTKNAIVAAFVGGVVVGTIGNGVGAAQAKSVDGAYRGLRVFGQVLSYVQNSYVDDVDELELIHDAVSGMLSDLDPHTTFMRPAEYQKLREDTAGEFGGLGITVTKKADALLVENVVDDGPAANAGVKVGDALLSVDGEPIGDLSLEQSVKLLRGVPGTRVVVKLRRIGFSTPREIALIRRHVRVNSVESMMLDDHVGYARIRVFQERTDDELANHLRALTETAKATDAKGLKGLVLDLRDNPGGLFDEGVRVADRFLSDGDIVRTEGRNPRDAEVEHAVGPGTEPPYPVAVIVNGGTASSSEIVAGALQDRGRGVIVGMRSYGKGSVQTLYGLDDGSGLKLTVARYFTPAGRSIQETGVVPDVVVKPEGDEGNLKSDRQLQAALASVRANDLPRQPATSEKGRR